MKEGVFKNVLPIVFGGVTGIGIIWFSETILMPAFFPALKIDQHDHDAVANAIASMSSGAFLLLLLNYAIASFSGGVVATMAAKRINAFPAIVVGCLLTIGGVLNLIYIHHPLWFSILNAVEYLPLALFGYRVARKKD